MNAVSPYKLASVLLQYPTAAIFEGLARRGHGMIHIRRRCLSNLREHFAAGRIRALERLRTFDPLAVDQ